MNVSVFVLSRRRARLNTSPVEWMSVSVSRLEAGRPSCDSMWLPGASRSWLLPLRGEEAGGEEVQGLGSQKCMVAFFYTSHRSIFIFNKSALAKAATQCECFHPMNNAAELNRACPPKVQLHYLKEPKLAKRNTSAL